MGTIMTFYKLRTVKFGQGMMNALSRERTLYEFPFNFKEQTYFFLDPEFLLPYI